MKKKGILFLAIAALLITAPVSAKEKVNISLNGKILETDVDPIIRENRTFVPLRFVGEGLQYDVQWDDVQRKVKISKGSDAITLTIGNKEALANGKALAMDVAPFIEQNRTMVPVRFVAESLKVEVDWDPDTRTVLLKSKEAKSFLEDVDTKTLTDSERAYLLALDHSQQALTLLTEEFRGFAFENFGNYTKEELVHKFDELSKKIQAEGEKGKNLVAPEKFKGSQALFAKACSRLPEMMTRYKEALLSDDPKAATDLINRLSDYSILTYQVVESVKTEAKGEHYDPGKALENYNEKKGTLESLEKLFKQL